MQTTLDCETSTVSFNHQIVPLLINLTDEEYSAMVDAQIKQHLQAEKEQREKDAEDFAYLSQYEGFVAKPSSASYIRVGRRK